ncbi:MAG: type 4 fimbrial assembly protein [Pseudomonadota bacterium]
MAITNPARNHAKQTETLFTWEGKDKNGKAVQGELRAFSPSSIAATLRRQGISAVQIKKKKFTRGKKISDKDICFFTRQLSTMLKAGVPLLQSFDIISQGNANPAFSKLLQEIRADIETGSSLHSAFKRHPDYFDALYCNLIAAGEQAGILEEILTRLALYKEKTLAVKRKIRSAMIYPLAILGVAVIVTTVIMIWVIPAFKDVFASFGAELPLPTQIVIWLSDMFVRYWYWVAAALIISSLLFIRAWKRSPSMQISTDKLLLKLPLFGPVIRKAIIARWTRTLSTMFAAGVPLVESLDSVGGASGNAVYIEATRKISAAVSSGSSLVSAMQTTKAFPAMVTQMVAIGEESGALDQMLTKVAEFHEEEVDNAVASLSSLMEPVIMVILGVVIGGLVIAMYLPIFQLGSVV